MISSRYKSKNMYVGILNIAHKCKIQLIYEDKIFNTYFHVMKKLIYIFISNNDKITISVLYNKISDLANGIMLFAGYL